MVRNTQSVVEVFAPEPIIPPEEIPPQELTPVSFTTTVYHFTKLWKIERTDGVTFYFTDHNMKIDFEGDTYTPVDGLSASAHERKSGLGVHNYEVTGILSDDAIKTTDLFAGRFKDAKVSEYLLNWVYPWAGAMLITVHWIDTVSFDGQRWVARLGGVTAKLNRTFGDYFTRSCRHTLGVIGDGKCNYNLTADEVTGAPVATVEEANTKFASDVTIEPPTTNGAGQTMTDEMKDVYWTFGSLTWTTGDNNGLSFDIKNYVRSTQTITLFIPTPFPIQDTDTFKITPGCDKTLGTCGAKFDNVVNAGMFPTIPGANAYVQGPQDKGDSFRDILVGTLFDIISP